MAQTQQAAQAQSQLSQQLLQVQLKLNPTCLTSAAISLSFGVLTALMEISAPTTLLVVNAQRHQLILMLPTTVAIIKHHNLLVLLQTKQHQDLYLAETSGTML